jgi:hypothetical protein
VSRPAQVHVAASTHTSRSADGSPPPGSRRAADAHSLARGYQLLEEAGAWPPDGLEYHVFFGPEGNMLVSEIWESQEKLEAFGQVLMPILAGQGIGFSSEPDVFEAHEIFNAKEAIPSSP